MNPERLSEMVNDIANFFAAEPDRAVAVDGVCSHLKRFWEPRMRRQIIAHVRDHGGGGLSSLGRAAVLRMAELEEAKTA